MPLFPIHQSVPQQPTPPATPPTTGLLAKDEVARARQLADLLRARFAQTLVGQDNLFICIWIPGLGIESDSVPLVWIAAGYCHCPFLVDNIRFLSLRHLDAYHLASFP